MTFDQYVRLFVLSCYAATCLVCYLRVFRTDDVRARVGNVAFGTTCGVAWYSQVYLWGQPLTTTTWLLGVAGCLCVAYLVVLARTEL